MTTHLDDIYRKVEVTHPRPVWDDEDSYPANRDAWSYRQWAWEFLRRNPAYQRACDGIDRSPSWLAALNVDEPLSQADRGAMVRQRLANEEKARGFGRYDLKGFRSNYRKEEDDERLWLAETVAQVKPWRASSSEIRMELESGQVAIIFDLSRCLESGKAAKASLLAHAKEILDRELETFDEEQPAGKQSKIVRVRRKQLFLWLRLYDAIEYAKAKRSEVAEVLYKPMLEGRPEDRQHRMTEVRKRISADLKRAREMVESGYRELVPLDWIQDRSSGREV